MKAIAITMATIIGVYFVAIESVQAQTGVGQYTYCKSGKPVRFQKACKENGGKW